MLIKWRGKGMSFDLSVQIIFHRELGLFYFLFWNKTEKDAAKLIENGMYPYEACDIKSMYLQFCKRNKINYLCLPASTSNKLVGFILTCCKGTNVITYISFSSYQHSLLRAKIFIITWTMQPFKLHLIDKRLKQDYGNKDIRMLDNNSVTSKLKSTKEGLQAAYDCRKTWILRKGKLSQHAQSTNG